VIDAVRAVYAGTNGLNSYLVDFTGTVDNHIQGIARLPDVRIGSDQQGNPIVSGRVAITSNDITGAANSDGHVPGLWILEQSVLLAGPAPEAWKDGSIGSIGWLSGSASIDMKTIAIRILRCYSCLVVACSAGLSCVGCTVSHAEDSGLGTGTTCDAGLGECDASLSDDSAMARQLFREYLALRDADEQAWQSDGCSIRQRPSADEIACMEGEATAAPAAFIAFLTELNAYLMDLEVCTYTNCVLEDSAGLPCSIPAPTMVRIGSPPSVADAQCTCRWQPFDSHLLFCPSSPASDSLNEAIERYFYLDTRTQRKLGQCTGSRIGFPDGYVACLERRAHELPEPFSAYFDGVLPFVEERWMCMINASCDDIQLHNRCPTGDELASYPIPPDVGRAFSDCFRPENRL